MQAAGSSYQWLNKEPVAVLAGFLGWFAPSNIGVPALGGDVSCRACLWACLPVVCACVCPSAE